MTQEQMQAKILELQKENQALKQAKIKPLVLKVSDKGALSIYGLGRFPTTLYVNQWARIFKAMTQIEKFISDNHSKFSVEKPEGPAKQVAQVEGTVVQEGTTKQEAA